MDNIKCVVVGDGWVGKTSMLVAFSSGKPIASDYLPTICENFTKIVEVDGVPCSLTLWDTSGQEEYARLRTLSYPNTDIFIMVFSIRRKESYNNITESWVPEVRHICPDAKLLLVGNKVDLRHQGVSKERPVSEAEGTAKCKEIKAMGYRECSALTKEGLQEVFEEAIRAVRLARALPIEFKKKTCNLL